MEAPVSYKAIGQYQLGDCIGKGAFGAVYRALNMETGEVVAIKQIKLANIPKAEINSLMMEIDLLKKLNHANIVKYTGFIKTSDFLYIILEFCENGSLQSVLKKFGKMSETLVAVYIYQVLQGLIYLHEEGVIHRDIKGANILTTKEGRVKLGDFGVATKQADNDDSSVVGSPYWMAPEVVEMTVPTTASDIWSVGCTIIELMQGVPPYFNFPPMAALFKIVQDDHPPFPEDGSPQLKDFLMQCFQKDHNLRTNAKKLIRHPWLQSARSKFEPNAPVETKQEKRSEPKATSSSDVSDIMFSRNSINIDNFVETQTGDFDDDLDFNEDNLEFKMKPGEFGNNTDRSNADLFEESDHDDPFHTLDESDGEYSAQPKDQKAKLSFEIMEIIEHLSPEKEAHYLIEAFGKMTKIFKDNHDLCGDLMKFHGVIPILTILENISDTTVLREILIMINEAFDGSPDLLDNFCLLGAVPRLLQLCEHSDYQVRLETCRIIKKLFSTSDLTRRVLVSCRGIDVLLLLLNRRYEDEWEIVWTAIEGIFTTLNFQGSSPRNDFCRLLVRREGLVKIAEIMHKLTFDRRPEADELLKKVLETLLIISKSDSFVKESMSNSTIVRRILYEYNHFSSPNQLTVLKCLKNVSVISSVLDELFNANAAETLVGILNKKDGIIQKELHNQAIYILFNYCRVNKMRQENAAVCGIVPHLQMLIETNNPLKQLALPVICDLAHCSKTSREILWTSKAINTYLSLLADNNTYWQVSGLEAIIAWMNEEHDSIEQILLEGPNIEKIIIMFVHAKASAMSSVVIPMQKLMMSSNLICKSLSKGQFIQKVLERLDTDVVIVKLNLLKILSSIVKCHSRPQLLNSTYDIDVHLKKLITGNCSVLAREIANNILQLIGGGPV